MGGHAVIHRHPDRPEPEGPGALRQQASGLPVGQDQLQHRLVGKVLPQGEVYLLPQGGDGELRLYGAPLDKLPPEVVGPAALVSGGADNDAPPPLGGLVDVGLEKGLALMGAEVGAIAEIDDTGHPPLLRLIQQILHRPHDVRGPGAGQLHRCDGGPRGRAAASGGDGGHGGTVAGLSGGRDQSGGDLLPGVRRPVEEARRRGALRRHVPQSDNPGVPVLPQKFRMRQVQPRVHKADEDPLPREAQPVLPLDRQDARRLQTPVRHQAA